MKWTHIDLGHRISTVSNGQNTFKKIAGSNKVLDEYYNTYLRKSNSHVKVYH
jgi:hypothetical protein